MSVRSSGSDQRRTRRSGSPTVVSREGGSVYETEHRAVSPAALVSNELVRLVANYTGRGPTKARTTLNSNVAVVVFQDTLTRGEQQLVAAGQTEAVSRTRRSFHDVMREEAVRAVQEILSRKVV